MAPARHVPVFSSAPSAPAPPQPAQTSPPTSGAAKRSTSRPTSRSTSPTTTSPLPPLPPTSAAPIAAAAVGARVGYARVSTREQNPDAQHDALTADGCTKVFTDHASGTLSHRPALTQALDYLRPGDTLVITKLDRLGRSVKNLKTVADDLQAAGVGLRAISQGIDTTTPGGRLFFHMLAAIAEFEHDLVVERTKDGLAAARTRGRRGGGVVKMTATKAAQARVMYEARGHTVAEIAATFGVSRATIYRHLTPMA